MASSKVEQIVSLNTSGYVKGLKGMVSENKAAETKMTKTHKTIADEHQSNSVKQIRNNFKVSNSVKGLARDFSDSFKKGALIGGAVALATGVKTAATAAAKSVLSIDKAMAKLQDKFDLSSKKLKGFRGQFNSLSKETGLSAGAIAEAGEIGLAASGGREAVGIDSIAKASKISGDSPKELARTVADFLKGSGQEFTNENVKDFLDSANSLSRKGDLSFSESIKALSLNSGDKAKSGLSNRENAALLSGASGVGQDRESSLSAINALVAKSTDGFGGDAALAGVLGVKGGFSTDGKFDVNKLREASENKNKAGLNKADFEKLLTGTGLSKEEAQGLNAILSEFDKFEEGFKKTVDDTKTLSDSFKNQTNNISDNMSKMNMSLSKAADQIISPLSKVGSDILNGDFSKGISNLGDALLESGKGALDNKAAVGGSIATVALAGLLSKKLGVFGSEAKERAIEAATGEEVTKVNVINFSEIKGSLGSDGLGAFKSKKMGGLFGGVAKAGGVLAAGAAGYAVGSVINDTLISKTVDKSGDGAFEGNAVERLIYSIDNFFGGENAKNFQKANKVQLEVVKNTSFTAKPVAADLDR